MKLKGVIKMNRNNKIGLAMVLIAVFVWFVSLVVATNLNTAILLLFSLVCGMIYAIVALVLLFHKGGNDESQSNDDN